MRTPLLRLLDQLFGKLISERKEKLVRGTPQCTWILPPTWSIINYFSMSGGYSMEKYVPLGEKLVSDSN